MDTYRIVKWRADRPETKERATERVYTSLEFAETVRATMERHIPERCFAVEAVKEPQTG